ncbi:MAG: FixH family protein, partial [Acidobacteriota bacterium]
GALAAIVTAAALLQTWRAHQPGQGAGGSEIQRVGAGAMTIVLLSPQGALHQGRNAYTIEFRRGDGTLVDVGEVQAGAGMAMPGMMMSGNVVVARTGVPGRYQATAEFGMAGAWKMTIQWKGAAGSGAVNFEGAVR